ncbi:hypothetical protein N431DRAFT_439901 [Stipitochalara longipes BDJ]|nr:hypothetical protein N431DRAFT_439901 [Stipitochalara longipes BDJ]
MFTFSRDPDGSFNAEAHEALRQAQNHETRVVAEASSGTKTNLIDLMATSSTTSSTRSVSVDSHFDSRKSGSDAPEESGKSSFPERAGRSVTRSQPRSTGTGMNEGTESESTVDFEDSEVGDEGVSKNLGQ